MGRVGQIWTALRSAADFESAVDTLAHGLAEAFIPPPLRAVAVLREGGDVRAVHTVPLVDARPLDGAAVCTAWRSVDDMGVPTLLATERTAGGSRIVASDETREHLAHRNTRHMVVCPLFGRRGLLVWEFTDAPTEWADAAAATTALSAWLPALRPATFTGGLTDLHLPVAGPAMAQPLQLLERFARHDEPILLLGETGVGKTRLARWIHARSNRRSNPMVFVNLLTIEENLRAAHLFGTRRGAFTGAVDTNGAVARAARGTLFIDEIDKLPLSTQAQLLQVLDDGGFQALGSTELGHADVRILTGTNADLAERVRAGAFLHDLYRRIAVLPVRIPPLRERRDDIGPWAAWFLAEHGRKTGAHLELDADAATLLAQLPWPGNLRQLNTVVVRAAALVAASAYTVDAAAIKGALALDPDAGSPLLTALEEAARAFVDLCEHRSDLRLEHLRSLRGLALALAVERHGKREGLRILGEGGRLEGDNHYRLLRDEADYLQKVCDLLRASESGHRQDG